MLLVGGAVLCFLRWQAWFGMPAEPTYVGDTLTTPFHCFGDDSVPGFIRTEQGWQDTIEPQVLRMIVLGDVHNQLDSADYAGIMARHDSVDCYAQVGDWMERCYFYYAQQLYHQIAGTGMDMLPVICCPGNHEHTKGIMRTLPDMWTNIFHHPDNGPERFIGSTFYVDFPQLRLIAINTTGLQRLSDYTITNTWLKRSLRTAGDRFTIVIMHHPLYSSGKGRFNATIWLTFHSVLQEADLVIAGHDHGFVQRGHFITTNSSRKLYKQKEGWAQTPAEESRLYELVEITQDTLRVQTYSIDSLDYVQTLQIAPLVQNRTTIAQ